MLPCSSQALDRDNREHSPEMGRQLAWDHEGQYIAQDVARGLYFLHNIDVRMVAILRAVNNTNCFSVISFAKSELWPSSNCIGCSLRFMCLGPWPPSNI